MILVATPAYISHQTAANVRFLGPEACVAHQTGENVRL
jgi:hypothetical protein